MIDFYPVTYSFCLLFVSKRVETNKECVILLIILVYDQIK